jgi:hypothetical protein
MVELPMPATSRQAELFGRATGLPDGFVYRPDFLTPAEEQSLLAEIEALPLREGASPPSGGS